METKKELLCECCKRPFKKPNLPLYNLSLYGLGVVCMDCANKIERMYREKGGFAIGRNAKSYMKSIKVNEKLEASMTYNKNEHSPFNLKIQVGEWADNTSFVTLDEVKKLRDVLDKFINECEV